MTWSTPTPSGRAGGYLTIHRFQRQAGGTSSSHEFSPGSKQLPLFSNVRLTRSLRADGESLPLGATGTIVERLDGGTAYVVEFFHTRHCVVTGHGYALATEDR